MVIDAANEDKPALVLAFADRAWLVAFAAATCCRCCSGAASRTGRRARSSCTRAADDVDAYFLVGPAISGPAGVSWWKSATQLPPRLIQTVEAKLSPKGWPAKEPLPVQ